VNTEIKIMSNPANMSKEDSLKKCFTENVVCNLIYHIKYQRLLQCHLLGVQLLAELGIQTMPFPAQVLLSLGQLKNYS